MEAILSSDRERGSSGFLYVNSRDSIAQASRHSFQLNFGREFRSTRCRFDESSDVDLIRVARCNDGNGGVGKYNTRAVGCPAASLSILSHKMI